MALSTLLSKNLNFSLSAPKHHHPLPHAPPLSPPSDLLSSAVTSFLPTYLKKYNSLHFSSATPAPESSTTSMDIDPSASTSNYHADADMMPADDSSAVDFASVYAAQRFFFPPPGCSSSITDSTSSITPPPDLYTDFRRSMEAAVAAYKLQDVLASWQSLQELLLHYLSINPDCTHNHIIDAFADLVVSLMPPPSETDSTTDYDVEMAAAYASHRFFFSPPGSSNSIFDSTSSTSPPENQERKHSPDLYQDFRRSMEETVAAYELHDVMASWQSLQEMLLRYLSQNPEHTHKFIIGAFADVLVSLMSPPNGCIGEVDTVDFSSVYTSHQSFFTCAGASSSMDDDSASSSESGGENEGEMVVQTYSPDPYRDFRRSMEEMVEARELHNVVANWHSLRELLLRYLSLNPESTHKFIISAFADLLVSLMSPPPSAGEARCLSGSLSSCGMSL